jgi:hypothetical protein
VKTKRHDGPAIEREFDRVLVESVDESTAVVLGEIARRAVYEILEKNFDISKDRIPERLNAFTSAFEKIFGPAIGKMIMRAVAKTLYSRLDLTFIEISDWRLPDYVTEARVRMTMQSDSGKRPLVLGDVSENSS